MSCRSSRARVAAVFACALALTACPAPVVPPPPPVDRPSEQVETLLDDALEAWARAHAQPGRGDDYRLHLSRAIDKARQAAAQGGGRNGLAKTLQAKFVYEHDGAAGVSDALALTAAACAEDKAFAPAFLQSAELRLARRYGEWNEVALRQAEADLEGAFHAIVWLEHGGRMGDPLPPGVDFYANPMQPPEEMVERLRVIERYLAFDLGNDGAIPHDLVSQLGGTSRRSASAMAVPGVSTIGRLKARHRLVGLAIDLARFDLEGQPVKPTLLADYRRILDSVVLANLDPDCFEAKLRLLEVQHRLAAALPTRTDETWTHAFDLARAMLELGNPLIRNDPRVRVIAYAVVAGYAEFRVSRLVSLADLDSELASHGALYESVETLTAEYLGPPGALVVEEPFQALALLDARLGYDLAALEFYARFAASNPNASRLYDANRDLCDDRFADSNALRADLPPTAHPLLDATLARLRERYDAAGRVAREKR